ncbi:SDR family NAD(P)-dependent oxidoreductase [Mycobacterium sp. C31M]
MTDLFALDGKVAVVTGGGRGIGVMIARGLLQAGAAKVYLSAREDAVHALFNNAGANWGNLSTPSPNPGSTGFSTSTSRASSC